MLLTDDNNYRLARMQESLLKVATGDRRYHLENYIKNVTVIDANAFDELVNIMKEVGKYNQSLEEELGYLEKVKKSYDQVLELQMRFRRVCEQYGGGEITLSDMSTLNIEYIEDRINIINGYLINIKNIEDNKRKLEDLNEKLINEEKKKDFLNKKILLFEKKLRDDFVHAKLKQIVFGKLESFDITSEYQKIGYDVISLMDHPDDLDNEYKNIDMYCAEVNEKYEATKLCYNSLYSNDSKTMMGQVEKEFYLAKYKYIMLKILKLVCNYVETYDLAKVKRENFVELINNRNVCLEKLGMRNPINIVSVVDIDGQMTEINELSECIKTIHSIRREIIDVTTRTEEMVNENNNFLIALTDTKEVIKSKVSLSAVDITSFSDMIVEEVVEEKKIEDNQVIEVKNISSSFKLILSKQKANGVIERICQMYFDKKDKVSKKVLDEEVIPELVLGPKENVIIEETVDFDDDPNDIAYEIDEEILTVLPAEETNIFDEEVSEDIFMDVSEPILEDVASNIEEPVIDNSLFETTTPFEEPVMFFDRLDTVVEEPKVVEIEPQEEKIVDSEEIVLPAMENNDSASMSEEMPDAFWVTDEDNVNNSLEEDNVLSFDEQIDALLSKTKEDINVKRKVI